MTADYIKRVISNIKVHFYDGKIICYEVYYSDSSQRKLLYDYDNIWSLFLFALLVDKDMYMHNIDVLENDPENVIICKFVKNGRVYSIITNNAIDLNIFFERDNKMNNIGLIYAVLNDSINVVHIFETFKVSIQLNTSIKCKDMINALLSFHNIYVKPSSFRHIKLMTDESYVEKIYLRDDIISFT